MMMAGSSSAGFDLRRRLDCAGICVAASKTGHEGRLSSSGLNHVAASGMHIDGMLRIGIWVMCLFW